MTITTPDTRVTCHVDAADRHKHRVGAPTVSDFGWPLNHDHRTGGLVIRVSTASDAGHIPGRPRWTCRSCANRWPCTGASEQLRAAFNDYPAGLSTLLFVCLHRAAGDLPEMAPAALFTRFLAWDRPANHPPPVHFPPRHP